MEICFWFIGDIYVGEIFFFFWCVYYEVVWFCWCILLGVC